MVFYKDYAITFNFSFSYFSNNKSVLSYYNSYNYVVYANFKYYLS